MAKKSNKSSDKVNDVSKPGETPASSNARPTITGHSPVIKNDPMVSYLSDKDSDGSKNKDDKDKKESKESYVIKSKPKIAPISEDTEKEQDTDTEKEQDTGKDTGKGTGKEPEDNGSSDEDKAKEDDKKENVNSDSVVIDALAQTADSKKVSSKKSEEAEKHKDYISGLAKNGKYRLPIIEGGHKGSAERFVSWIFLFLLIASIGAYLAVDAGYIEIGFNVPYEFIKD